MYGRMKHQPEPRSIIFVTCTHYFQKNNIERSVSPIAAKSTCWNTHLCSELLLIRLINIFNFFISFWHIRTLLIPVSFYCHLPLKARLWGLELDSYSFRIWTYLTNLLINVFWRNIVIKWLFTTQNVTCVSSLLAVQWVEISLNIFQSISDGPCTFVMSSCGIQLY